MCGRLKNIRLGRLAKLDKGAFYGCGQMEGVDLDNAEIYVEDNILYAQGGKTLVKSFVKDQKHITLPSGVASIGYGAFERGLNIESVVLNQEAVAVDGKAFENCIKLNSINLENIKVIGEGAFIIAPLFGFGWLIVGAKYYTAAKQHITEVNVL